MSYKRNEFRDLKSNSCNKVGRPQAKVVIAIPDSFETWFIQGMRNYESKGVEFELMPGMAKITWPGKVPVLRTFEDFRREYETDYASKFVVITNLPFEEGVGVF